MTALPLGLKKNVSLKNFSTFKIGGPAKFFVEIRTLPQLASALNFAQEKGMPWMVLGGGSNILFSDQGFRGLVMKINNRGLKFENKGNHVIVTAAAGESWDNIVRQVTAKKLWGIENLSYIPGLIGAVPVQNVGAYGQDTSSVLFYVEAYDAKAKKIVRLSNKQCKFGYRTSVFKTTHKNRFVIWQVALLLKKHGRPIATYPDINRAVGRSLASITPERMRQLVIKIRQKKLPDPRRIGNVGSFFKNLILTEKQFANLKKKAEKLGAEAAVRLEEAKNKFRTRGGIKVPTAMLLDILGLKGKRLDGAEVFKNQPLIIVNRSGQTKAADVLRLNRFVRSKLFKEFGVSVINEPDFIGFNKQQLKNYLKIK